MKRNSSLFLLCSISVLFLFAHALLGCGSGGSSSVAFTTPSIEGTITSDSTVVALRSQRRSLWVAVRNIEFVSKAYADDEEDEGVPLDGATVQLLASDGTPIDVTTTDENGKFAFHAVPAGEYSIEVVDPRIEPLIIEGVSVIEGDISIVRGRVTHEGGVGSVEFEVADCSDPVGNDAQMGHAQALADAAGVTVDEVVLMRTGDCLGWGVVAKNLGVPSQTIGLGHTKIKGGGAANAAGGKPEHAGPKDKEDKENNGNGGGKPEHAGPKDKS